MDLTRWKPAGSWLLAMILAAWSNPGNAAVAGSPPRVVADIAPVHSLVASVMDGVATPDLLFRAGSSPHDYSMKPSEARMLDAAEIVVWTGPTLTPWLQDTLSVLAERAELVTFSGLEGVALLPFRTDAGFDADDEDLHGHDAAHAHAADVGADPHLWLDPRNAAVLVAELARVLSDHDPENAAKYRANAQAVHDRLARLEADINAIVAPLRSRPFLVFHDAYHYFEARFDISAIGSVAMSDAVPPGAGRLRDLQRLIADQGVVCVFAEPQFEPKLVARLTAGTAAKAGVLDPVGASIAPGPDHYAALLRAMAGDLSDCLSR